MAGWFRARVADEGFFVVVYCRYIFYWNKKCRNYRAQSRARWVIDANFIIDSIHLE